MIRKARLFIKLSKRKQRSRLYGNVQELYKKTAQDVQRRCYLTTGPRRSRRQVWRNGILLETCIRGTSHYCRDRTEYNLLVVSVVVLGHFQRPSVATNLTIEEFVRAKTASDGRVIVLVSDHKTGAQGPAQIALEPPHYKLFLLYSKRSVTTHLHVRR